MAGFLRNILTGVDNQSFDSGRVIWVFGSLAYIVSAVTFQGFALWKGQPFDPLQFCTGFGTGFAAVLAAGGWGIKQKDKGVAEAQAATS